MTRKRGLLLFCLVAAGMLLIQGSVFGVSAEKEAYKVGAIFAITGGASWLGEPERNTVRMIEEQINMGGGINGHPLQIIIEDTVGDATRTVTAIKKLINKDKVLAIIGPSRSGTTMAIIPIVEEAEIPLISCAAAEAIVIPVKRWVFKTPQKDSDAAVRIFEYMNKQDISEIAIITGATGFGDQGRGQLQKLAPEFGITIVVDETYGPEDTDMTAQLTKIKASEAEAVVNWSIVAAQSIVAKNMRQLGMEIPLFQSHGFGNIKFVQLTGEAGEGIVFPCGRLLAVSSLPDGHPQKELLLRYKWEYETKYDEDVSTFGGHAWDALHLVIEALREVGPDREKIRDYIENRKGFVGTGGVFNFSPEDHSGLDKYAFEMLTVKDEKFVMLK